MSTCFPVYLSTCLRFQRPSTGSGQRLIQVPENIVDLLETNAQADKIGADASADLLFGAQLAVGGGSRMDGQAFGIPDVCQVTEELQALDELLPGFRAAFDAKTED